MMNKPQTFRDLIARIGGVSTFALAMGIPASTAKKMRDRSSVATHHWAKLQEVARAHGLLFTSDDFVQMKAQAIPEKPRKREAA
jgi:hypothetical protein